MITVTLVFTDKDAIKSYRKLEGLILKKKYTPKQLLSALNPAIKGKTFITQLSIDYANGGREEFERSGENILMTRRSGYYSGDTNVDNIS